MEDGLVLNHSAMTAAQIEVLILVVVEDGLVPRPYKTILIINKLKNSTKQFFTFLNRKLTFS